MTHRTDVEIPTAEGRLAAWLYRPERSAGSPAPCVILAHGFTGVRDLQLHRPAEGFAEAGFFALVFDYRHFGDSDGAPRQLVDLRRQYEDWDAALAYASRLDGVDASRIVLWGTSFCGGHVVDAAVRNPQVAAVIAQTPFMDGLAQPRPGLRIAARLMLDGILDELAGRRGRPPRLIPAVAAPGGYGVMIDQHTWETMLALLPEGTSWRNEVAARIALRVALHRPGARAGRVRCPLLVQIVGEDSVISNRAAARAARRAPRGQLRSYAGMNHFDIYLPPGFDRLFADQLEFLRRSVPA